MTPIKNLCPHVSPRAWNSLMNGWNRYGVPEFTTVEQLAETSDCVLLELRNMGPKMLAEVRAAVAKVIALPPPVHEARRDSDVAAWIKAYRDQYAEPKDSPYSHPFAWHVLDELLNDYRDHADTGVPLGEEIHGPGSDA